MNVRHLEIATILLVAGHSAILGAAMLFQPAITLEFCGWDYQGPMFFPAQSGVFLILSSGVFLAAIRHRKLICFIIASKGAAVVFLVSQHFLLSPAAPAAILLAAAGDGIMGTTVAAIFIWQVRISKLQSSRLDDR